MHASSASAASLATDTSPLSARSAWHSARARCPRLMPTAPEGSAGLLKDRRRRRKKGDSFGAVGSAKARSLGLGTGGGGGGVWGGARPIDIYLLPLKRNSQLRCPIQKVYLEHLRDSRATPAERSR